MQNHRELRVWRDGIDLVKQVYEITRQFPEEERFGLVAQMRRAAVSIPSNIAEGAARSSRADFARLVAIARGSVAELETQYIIAVQLGYIREDDPLHKVLTGLFASLNKLHRRLVEP